MNTTITVPNAEADEIATAAAEAHRLSHAHTVSLLPGAGWVCSVCDEDHDEVVAEYLSGGRSVAWDREETDPCERSTPGCAINHAADSGACEGW